MKGKQILAVLVTVGLALAAIGGLSLAQGPEAPTELTPQAALGSAFTYQSELTDGGSPADGEYDFQFALYDAAEMGSPLGTEFIGDVLVSGGFFAVELDYGPGVFDGQARWLQIAVRDGASTGAYTTLTPRQALTAAPYAQFSQNADLLDYHDSADFLQTSGGTVAGNLIVAGSMGVGTTSPQQRLHVIGAGLFDVGPGQIEISTPGSYPGFLTHSSNGNRRDIAFRPEGIALLTSSSDSLPSNSNGVWISEDGYLGVGTSNPAAELDVAGAARFDVGTGQVEISTPGSYPGFLTYSSNGNRRDIAFRPEGIALLTSNSGGLPSNSNGIWISEEGKLGVGTAGPDRNLTVYNPGAAWQNVKTDAQEILMGADVNGGIISVMSNSDLILRAGGNNEKMRVKANGYVGIGTSNPSQKLHVEGGARFKVGGGTGTNIIDMTTPGSYPGFLTYTSNGNRRDIAFRPEGIALLTSSSSSLPSNSNGIWISEAGNLGVGTWAPAAKLDVQGTTRTGVLQITGGSDLAEPFEVAGAESIEPGMLVAIDPEHAGQLRLAEEAYDRTVAGCVSGANGVNPGLTMEQEGTEADGEFPVALAGRVYCWATAANGPIEPGDLLTTSDLPGYAMKVTDYSRAQGATIGKAMGGLAEGEGLILVLVTLQ